MKRVVAYLPLFGDVRVHPKVFKAFVDMLGEKIDGYEIVPFIHTVGPSLDFNRNDAFGRIMGAFEPEFIMCCDADNIMPRNVISKLMASMDDTLGAVSALYFKKAFPHMAVQGNFLPMDEKLEVKRPSLKEQDLLDPYGGQCLYYTPIRYFDVVRPIDVFGMGCVLLNTQIFRYIKQPYFKYINGYSTSDHTFGSVSEDIFFCGLLKKAGIVSVCNPKVISAHLVEKWICGSEVEESCVPG